MRRIHPVPEPHRRDHGATLVEILISMVLLGIGVGAMLTMLTVTIKASSTERDHANAHAWLQTATDVLYGEDHMNCNAGGATNEQAVYDAYWPAVKAADNPAGWPDTNIEIVRPILFWNGSIYQSTCYDDDGWNLQLIRLQVRNPDGNIVESVEVVKG